MRPLWLLQSVQYMEPKGETRNDEVDGKAKHYRCCLLPCLQQRHSHHGPKPAGPTTSRQATPNDVTCGALEQRAVVVAAGGPALVQHQWGPKKHDDQVCRIAQYEEDGRYL
jgi:hypothetical protein